MRVRAPKLGILLAVLLVPVFTAEATPPAPTATPAPPKPEKYCVSWTVPDLHPAPEVQRVLDEIKATTGVVVIDAEIGKEVCFATGEERDAWMREKNTEEYMKWVQSQPGYDEARRFMEDVLRSKGITVPPIDPDPTDPILFEHAGYGR